MPVTCRTKLPTFETVTSKQGVRTRVRVEEKVPTGLNEEQAALFRKGQQEQRLEQQQLLKQQQEDPQKKQLTWGTPGSCSIPRVVEEQARVLPAAGGAALQFLPTQGGKERGTRTLRSRFVVTPLRSNIY